MFVRKKVNKSGSTSVVVVDKSGGSFRQVKSFGSSSDPKEIEAMWRQANEWVVRYGGQQLIDFDATEQAAASGRSVSEYIRAKLFGGEKATINAVGFLEEYRKQIYEMHKTGNNINQLAHYANICIKSGKLSEAVVQEMNQRFGELIKIEIKLKDAMRKIIKA